MLRGLPFFLLACAGPDEGPHGVVDPIVVVTFNTGTTPGLAHDDPDDGYTREDAETSDQWYGDGLAWVPAVEAVAALLADVQPDVIAFQEVFDPARCPDIPEAADAGFVCDGWAPGDPSVAERVLGAGYAVACHPGRDDKCVGVREGFGALRPCDGPDCVDGLTGTGVETCGSGARVAHGVVERPDGSAWTLVSVHGSSGLSPDEQACRVAQLDQAFAAVDGGRTVVVLGDFNVDPVRQAGFDASADALVAGAEAAGLTPVTAWDADAPPTYAGFVSIDHVLARGLDGDCVHPGVTAGEPAVIDAVYFDHVPAICEVVARP